MSIEEFITLFKEELEIEADITPTTEYMALDGWSSLSMMELIVLMNDSFCKTFKVSQIRNCSTIADLYHLAND